MPIRPLVMKIRAFSLTVAVVAGLSCVSVASQKGIAYHEADKELNVTYNKVLAIMTDPEDKRLFIEAQRAWLKFRDARVAFHDRYFGEGGFWVSVEMLEARTKELKLLLTKEAQENRRPQDQKR